MKKTVIPKPKTRIGGRGSNWGGRYSVNSPSPIATRAGKKVTTQ